MTNIESYNKRHFETYSKNNKLCMKTFPPGPQPVCGERSGKQSTKQEIRKTSC